MKKWLVSVAMVAASVGSAGAYDASTFINSFNWELFKVSARAGTYYDFIAENTKFSAMKNVVKADFISLDAGYATRFISGEKGTFLAGGTLFCQVILLTIFCC